MDPVEALQSTTASAGLALVAGHRRIVEVLASRSLQKVSTIGGHVAQLAGCARHDRLRQQRVFFTDERMICGFSIRRKRTNRDSVD